MALCNGPDEFGLVTRVFHWGMMALVIAMLALERGSRIWNRGWRTSGFTVCTRRWDFWCLAL